MKKEKEALIDNFKILTDRREQCPYIFPNTIMGTLDFGDYTIEYDGIPYYEKICVERKGSVSEIYSATGSQRDRWERELEKLARIEVKIILCEFSYMDIINKQTHGILSASAVYGSICKWNAVYDIPFIFCENKMNARAYLYKLFREYVKHKILKF